MIFNSLEFIIFFPVVVFLLFTLSPKYRWMLLLAASYYFYMCWKAEYIVLIIASTLVDYFAAIQIENSTTLARKRQFLALSIIANLGILFLFKYFNFFNASTRHVLAYFNIFYGVPAFDALLPVGISFYTFQTMSYTIDVYNGHKNAERHLGFFALYVTYFPQLVAGPIERVTSLLPQLRSTYRFEYDRAVSGLRTMLWGFFKKIVIADRMAVVVNEVYGSPSQFTGIPLIFATYCFAIQIYCDFSGYTDIAIGASRVMGIDLMENFKRPYFSKSIGEFWRRWHISLSTWFKDYVYVPLGGNQVSKARWAINISLVFLLSGLWHGANWTYIIWGALHAFYILFAFMTLGLRGKLLAMTRLDRHPRALANLNLLLTFHLVSYAWIFFRANTVADAVYISNHLLSGLPEVITSFSSVTLESRALLQGLHITKFEALLTCGCILFLIAVDASQRRGPIGARFIAWPAWQRWMVYSAAMWTILLFGAYGNGVFIYFAF